MDRDYSDITLRRMTPEDATGVAGIWRLGWSDGHLGFVSDELGAARTDASFLERATERVNDTTVAEVGGNLAGFIMVVNDEAEQVYVSREHRGTDVAKALIGEVERMVGDAGYNVAWLAVVEGNARARRFYERSGWRDEGKFDYVVSSKDGPITIPCHRYEKDIA